MPLRLGVLVSGRGSNLQAIIDAIEAKTLDATIALVVSNKKNAMALERAKKHGVKGLFLDPKSVAGELEPRRAYDEKILQVLKDHGVQLVLLAGYMKIVTTVLIEVYQWRMMNIHPSLLPSFPGLHAQQQALDAGVKVSGCTVHFVTEGVDEGPIIVQSTVSVNENDSLDTLSARILEQEHQLYPRAVQLFAERRLAVKGLKARILETAQ
ncbi:MAG: phosphoribosylglycinamide formyltransferase [Nitrospirota bacterium]|nr:phosphoribosylglycinamide formyltransferase [Nitrospirota bacterium]